MGPGIFEMGVGFVRGLLKGGRRRSAKGFVEGK